MCTLAPPRVAAVSSVRQCGSLSDSRRRPELLLAVYYCRTTAAYYAGPRKCSAGKYTGSRKCSTKNMLGHGSAVRKISWVTEVQYEKISWGTEDHCDSPPPALVAPSPRRPFGVLCSSVPQSDFHSHPPLAEDAPSFWASPSDLRHRVVARSLALLSRLALALAPSLSPPRERERERGREGA